MNSSTIYKITSLILAIGLIALAFFFFQEKKHSSELLSELEKTDSEKTQVTSDLEKMLFQYDDLKTNSDSLNVQLAIEQKKIKNLLKNIKNVKYSNKQAIEQYKKETETLRNIMRSYIVQIDSLNTMNKSLIAENKEVKSQYESVQEEKNILLLVTDSLTGRVAEAEQLLVKGIFISGLNKRDKETDNVERIEKFKTCIDIRENKLAKKGNHTAYIRISMPDKSVLYESSEDLFLYKGDNIVYTAYREFDFDGKDKNICIFYKHVNPPLTGGNYNVDIFIDNERVSSASFQLK
ncbi:MAG: hypothetical protein KAI79_07065 [Bacteroidales bacterium]|nr:hypothetical protein [Bacteroidales bacterium]